MSDDKITYIRESLTENDILEEGPSICELILQARKAAIRNGIEANSIMLNKNIVHVPEKFGYYPEMICGLKVYATSDELPDNYAFAVFNNPWHKDKGSRLEEFESIGMEPDELRKAAALYKKLKEEFDDTHS